MKALVKLYGTLPCYCSGIYPISGLEVEISDNTTVADLVDLVGLTRERVALVSINGLLCKAHNLVPDGADVKFFQPLSGG